MNSYDCVDTFTPEQMATLRLQAELPGTFCAMKQLIPLLDEIDRLSALLQNDHYLMATLRRRGISCCYDCRTGLGG